MLNNKLKIIAGPCSIDNKNKEEVIEIASLRLKDTNKKAVWGVRVIGLKSRTYLTKKSEEMGIDFLDYKKNLNLCINKKNLDNFFIYKSIEIAKKIIKETNTIIATEIVDPIIQLPLYNEDIFRNKLFIWNPAVNQLGYQTHIMGIYAKKNNWYLGIKNPKWYSGENISDLNTMEKTWEGQISYSLKNKLSKNIFLIHRGVDTKEKRKMRNFPVHKSAEKIKEKNNIDIFFDPSHLFGPFYRNKIIKETIKAMKLKTINNNYLYNGILIEVGNSKTDTNQHISIKEFKELVFNLSKFREIES